MLSIRICAEFTLSYLEIDYSSIRCQLSFQSDYIGKVITIPGDFTYISTTMTPRKIAMILYNASINIRDYSGHWVHD